MVFPLELLPGDLLFEVFSYLHILDLLAVGRVNRAFFQITNNEVLWKRFCRKHSPKLDQFSWKKFARWLYYPEYAVSGGRQCSILVNQGKCIAFGVSRMSCSSINPEILPSSSRVFQVSSKNHHCMALTAKGEVLVWGSNDSSQLAELRYPNNSAPMKSAIHVPLQTKVTMISAGDFHSLVATEDGKCFAWGSNNALQCNSSTQKSIREPTLVDLGQKVIGVAAGSRHSLALTELGQVFSWGANRYGANGRGQHASPDAAVIGDLLSVNVTEIHAGGRFSLAKTDNGDIYCWGINSNSCLMLPLKENHYTPEKSNILSAFAFVQISCGYAHTVGLLSDGSVISWGGSSQLHSSESPFLISRNSEPTRIELPARGTRVGTGRFHSWVLLENDLWFRWGRNTENQLLGGASESRGGVLDPSLLP